MMKYKTHVLFSIMLLSTSLLAQQDNKANDILDKVRDGLSALSASFQQYEVDANDRKSEVLTGVVWLRAPDQFKWQYQEPVPQLIMANGKQVWVYDEDLEQVTVKQQRSQQNPIYVLLNKELSEKNYQISYDQSTQSTHQFGDKQVSLQWVKMTPLQSSEEVKEVYLGIRDNQLSVLKLKNQLDNVVVFEFDEVKRNPQLAQSFFTFIVPEGTDVIRESAPDIGEF